MLSKFVMTAALAVLSAGAAGAAISRPVYVNGQRLQEPAIVAPGGRTLLPMRLLFEALDARVEWDAGQRAVYAWKRDGAGVRIPVGSTTAQILEMSNRPEPGNWGRVVGTRRLDAPARMVGARVYVPVRFAAESLNAEVQYRRPGPAVYVRSAGAPHIDPPLPDDRPRPGDRPPTRDLDQLVRLDLEVPEERIQMSSVKAVTFTLNLTNLTARPLDLNFNSGQQYNFEVIQEGRVFWSWAANRAFTQALTTLRLQPNEKKSFTVRWDMKTTAGRNMRPGRYTVRAVVPSNEGELRTERRLVLR